MKRLLVLIIFVPFFLSSELYWTAEGPIGFSASVHIPKTRISIDEELPIKLTLTHPSTHTPDFDTIRLNLLKYVGVTEPPFALKSETIEKESQKTTSITFYMEPQLAKIHFLSFYDILFLPVDETLEGTTTLISDIFEIEVFLKEINPAYRGYTFGLLSLTEPLPIGLDFNNKLHLFNPLLLDDESKRSSAIVSSRTIPWTQLIGILLFCIVLFIARMQPKKAPDPNIEKKKRAATAKERALSTLNALDSFQKEAFYLDLTDTVRHYIEEKYQIHATKQTTQEFLYAMTEHPTFDRETQAMLSDFMVSSDRIKFADQEPTVEDCQEARQTAEQLINLD